MLGAAGSLQKPGWAGASWWCWAQPVLGKPLLMGSSLVSVGFCHQHSRVPGTGEMFDRELLDSKRTVSVYFLKLDSLG